MNDGKQRTPFFKNSSIPGRLFTVTISPSGSSRTKDSQVVPEDDGRDSCCLYSAPDWNWEWIRHSSMSKTTSRSESYSDGLVFERWRFLPVLVIGGGERR